MTKSIAFPSAEEISRHVALIHAKTGMFAIAVTGGYAGFQGLLWQTAGASGTVLESCMPYRRTAIDGYIGHPPERYCSPQAADELAMAAYRRAKAIMAAEGDTTTPVFGLGATASLKTQREKRGKFRAYVTVYGDEGIVYVISPSSEIVSSPDFAELSREQQGRYCDLDALNCMLAALKLPTLKLPTLDSGPSGGWKPWVVLRPDGQHVPSSALDSSSYLFYPGSFDPWHEGHRNAARAAAEMTGKSVIYMMDSQNPDKPGVTDEEIGRRLRQFGWREHVIVTQGTGLYVDKARRFPGFGFIVGADTMRRICLPKYYFPAAIGATMGMEDAFAEFIRLGTRFYVLDRFEDGRLLTLPEIEMPDDMRAICARVPGRWDVSSTEIRAKNGNAT